MTVMRVTRDEQKRKEQGGSDLMVPLSTGAIVAHPPILPFPGFQAGGNAVYCKPRRTRTKPDTAQTATLPDMSQRINKSLIAVLSIF